MAAQKVKVLMLLPNLVGAGGQKAALNLFLALDREQFEPKLLVQEKVGSFLADVEDFDNVEFLLDREFRRSDLPYLLRETTKHARSTDIVIAALEGRASFCGLIAAKISRKPVVAWIHIDWQAFIGMVSWRQKISLRSYSFADHVVACSVGAAENFARLFSVPAGRVSTIYNGIPLDRVRFGACAKLPTEAQTIFNRPTVVMVGRLDEQKGYSYIIEAHARLIKQGMYHNLVIIGEGALLPELQSQAAGRGVGGSVHFLGFQPNPHPFMKHATLFASSSLFEGFGLVLVEAMACGTPVVATDCPSGPAEVLANGEFGRLVPPTNVDALASALHQLLLNPAERDRLSRLGPERAEAFEERSKTLEWEKLLKKFAHSEGSSPNLQPA